MATSTENVIEELRIDGQRLMSRLDELAQIGAIYRTQGCARLALSDEDKAGRDLVVGWMRDLGLQISVDGIGNVVGTTSMNGVVGTTSMNGVVGTTSMNGVVGTTSMNGVVHTTSMNFDTVPMASRAPVMMGSHIDTVATGGRFDGNLGVLAGLEVIESVLASGIELEHPLAVAFFTDEEGARFAPDMLGSLVHVGGLALEEALDIKDANGAQVGAELERIGYRGGAPCPAPAPHAYVELHIEQGPVLEVEGRRIGAVTGVQGISWTEVTFVGQSNHAGTTPMTMRRDPGVAAAALVVFVHDLVDTLGPPQVGTVGRIDLHPNLVNVVAARATVTVDLRNTDEDALAESERRLADEIAEIAARYDVEVSTRSLARFEPVDFDPSVVDLVVDVAAGLGHDALRMPSGAGHDAQMLARVCPSGMVFVPSVNGLSHNPAEHTDTDDIIEGANVLLHTVLRLARQP